MINKHENYSFLCVYLVEPENSTYWNAHLHSSDYYTIFVTYVGSQPNLTYTVIYYGLNAYYDGQTMKQEAFASWPLYEDKMYTFVAQPLLHRLVKSLWYVSNPEFTDEIHVTLDNPY